MRWFAGVKSVSRRSSSASTLKASPSIKRRCLSKPPEELSAGRILHGLWSHGGLPPASPRPLNVISSGGEKRTCPRKALRPKRRSVSLSTPGVCRSSPIRGTSRWTTKPSVPSWTAWWQRGSAASRCTTASTHPKMSPALREWNGNGIWWLRAEATFTARRNRISSWVGGRKESRFPGSWLRTCLRHCKRGANNSKARGKRAFGHTKNGGRAAPSADAALAARLLIVVCPVFLDVRVPLLGDLIFGEDRLDRTLGLASAAVDALVRIDVKLVRLFKAL